MLRLDQHCCGLCGLWRVSFYTPANKYTHNQYKWQILCNPAPFVVFSATHVTSHSVSSAGCAGCDGIFLKVRVENVRHKKGYRLKQARHNPHNPPNRFALPDKGSFLCIHGEGNANRDIPLGSEVATYATAQHCTTQIPQKKNIKPPDCWPTWIAAQPRHWHTVIGFLQALVQWEGARECHLILCHLSGGFDIRSRENYSHE